jgi:hypothetical protein
MRRTAPYRAAIRGCMRYFGRMSPAIFRLHNAISFRAAPARMNHPLTIVPEHDLLVRTAC